MKEIKSIPMREGYNGILVQSQNEENGIVKLTLQNSAAQNTANVILKKGFETKTVYLRENASAIEWTEEKNGEWTSLCSGNDDVVLKISQATGFAKSRKPQEENVVLVINGNDIRFRAKNWLKSGCDIANDTILRSSINGNFQQMYIREMSSDIPDDYAGMEGVYAFKCTGDNIPSIKFNGTAIGALHGYNCISSLKNDLGLTETAIGEIFVRKSDNQRYMLVRANEELIWFCPFDDDALATGDFGKYAQGNNKFLLSQGDVIISENKVEYSIPTNAAHEQFRFSTARRVQRAFLDGVCEVDLTKNGLHKADFIDFYESYDILYLPSMLKYLRDNKGKNIDGKHNDDSIKESYMNFSSTHRFHKNGSYTVYQTNTALTKIYDVDYFGVMSMPFNQSPHYVYAPESKNLPIPTYQEKERVVAIGNPARVRSFYHMTDEKGTKSVNVGYYPYHGVAGPDKRTDAVRRYSEANTPDDELQLGMWYTSYKMYPYYYNIDKMDVGDEITLIGYHVPAIPIDEDFFAINWHFVGDEIYLALNCDKAVNKTVTTLPEYMNGLKISIEQKSDNFQINSDIIENNSISVSSNAAGYAILKLSK